jgi:colicin import membrane protein
MKFKDNPGLFISSSVHATLLAAALISFAQTPKFEDAEEAIPVETLNAAQFNQIMKGEKSAHQIKPRQRSEKIADLSEIKPAPPLNDARKESAAPPPPVKPQIEPGQTEVPAPPEKPQEKAEMKAEVKPLPPRPIAEPVKQPAKPEPKPEAAKPVPVHEEAEAIEPKPAPRPKLDPKPSEPQKKPEPHFKPDQVAKLLEQEKQQETPRKPADKPSAKPKSGEDTSEPHPQFDPTNISKFLNKDAPQHKASTGSQLQQLASLGTPTASAAKMSPSMWGALDSLLQDQYKQCWSYPGLRAKKYVPEIHVQYAQDGKLIGQPALLNPPADPELRGLAESALRAVKRCDPLKIPAQYQPFYDQWKGRIVRFDPEEML